ncbi:hypothetical protein AAT19DRAFT_8648 [Rhodotorula toruloides]|uniref:Uncharacterized protein n=1 Tax=Rhodotorula toruloides TaxID=5286 RepID=A0A2T0AHX9_RHOTO|nr:hypothetical protein AAT19DRAFT_8648 [Rhodotorula toruloides]
MCTPNVEEAGDGRGEGGGEEGQGDEGTLTTAYRASPRRRRRECNATSSTRRVRNHESAKLETRGRRSQPLNAQPISRPALRLVAATTFLQGPRALTTPLCLSSRALSLPVSLAPSPRTCEGHTLPSLAPARPLLALLSLLPFALRMLRRMERLTQHMASTQTRTLSSASQALPNHFPPPRWTTEARQLAECACSGVGETSGSGGGGNGDDSLRPTRGRGNGRCEPVVWVADCDGVRSCGTGWLP